MRQMDARHRHQVPLQRDLTIARKSSDQRLQHFIAGRHAARPQQPT